MLRAARVAAMSGTVLLLTFWCAHAATGEITPPAGTEPNIGIAKQWWPEMSNKWTVVGWKDHILRFNVLHNGTIINHASWMGRLRAPHPDPNCMFYFRPATTPGDFYALPAGVGPIKEDRQVVQGWKDSETPVLWSEWQYRGQLIRQEVFAHTPGGQELKRGNEPLFAWVRLYVHYTADGVPVPDNTGMGIQINYPSFNLSMTRAWTLAWLQEGSKYRRELSADLPGYDRQKGFRVLEPDGRVLIGVPPGQNCEVALRPKSPTENDSLLHIGWQGKTVKHVDVLIPMMPMDRDIFDRELALGREAAFREAEAYWKSKPETAATFRVPEDYVNQLIRRTVQSSVVTSERDPETGTYTMLTGGMGYGVGTWATPVSLTMAGTYLPMGRFDVVERYLQGVKKSQGAVVPPGDGFRQHPGYLSLPANVQVVPWLPDHGSLLWLISQHVLLSGDKAYADEWTPVILKACEWIRYARRIEHKGLPGVMPAAGASDDESRVQSVWTDAWIYKGLVTAVKALKATGHPRAAEFEQEAKEYKAAFQKAFRAKLEQMPTWKGPDGKERRLPPTQLTKEQDWQLRHLFYLDTGPLTLVFGGLLDAGDPVMKDSLLWFREGPPARMARFEHDLEHMPFLYHEVSSWEICYSWNIFHSWQLNDRNRFLEGMYSMLAGGYSQQTFSACEERGGMLATTNWIPAVLHLRNAVIDDEIREDELHLLRICPLAWLRTDSQAQFVNMPTCYGPVTLKASLKDGGKTLQVFLSAKLRSNPHRIVLHIPPVPGLSKVVVNGKPVAWDRAARRTLVPPAAL